MIGKKILIRSTVAALAFAIAGCSAASNRSSATQSSRGMRSAGASGAVATTQNASDPREFLTLSQIQPVPKLAAPATRPSTPAPLAAIQLYARARAAEIDNQRYTAISFLEKAVALDPYSYELYSTLGKAYLGTAGSNAQAISAFEKAAALKPDDLAVQYELGREYLARNDVDDAMRHLRLALLTTGYKSDDNRASAALVDFFLARALEKWGYDRAALDQFNVLIARLPSLGGGRGSPELAYLVSHPELLYAQVGNLYAKHGDNIDALHAYDAAASKDPDDFDLQARLTRSMVAAGFGLKAREHADALVVRFHADDAAIELLKNVCHRMNDDSGVEKDLAALHESHSSDRTILVALVDAMQASGQSAAAERLLADAVQKTHGDSEVVARLFGLYQAHGEIVQAMKLLVESVAQQPDSLRDLGPLWTELLKPARGNALRLPALQKLDLPRADEAARQYWIARMAELSGRDALAHSALEQAIAINPPFAPAYRQLLSDNWSHLDWDEAHKIEAGAALASQATALGNPGLAAELEGLSLFIQKKSEAAATAFAHAVQLGDKSPDAILLQADALTSAGNPDRATQLYWKLISEWPRYGEAYSSLFNLYIQQGHGEQAANVLKTWLEADPISIDGRLLQASVFARSTNTETQHMAESIILKLFAEQPDDPRVLQTMEAFYIDQARIPELITRLEDERTLHPDNREIVDMLVSIYAREHRTADADRVLDAARAADARDADSLYYVAHMYERLDQKQMTETILQDVVRLDPQHAGASNDLGYTWADEGRNLDKAEALIRVAVNAEPDNQSYLDSLGWVSYKLGKFAQARTYLDRAVGPAQRPDPVVLNHLGDALYRLDQPAEAAKVWERSLKRLNDSDNSDDDRDDLKTLRNQLEQKLKQQQAGKPVNVAPVVEMPLKPAQARK